MSLILEREETFKPAENDKVFKLIPPQAGFFSTNARYPAYVAGWATGKSLVGILKAMKFSQEFPKNLGIVFRKEFTDLRDSTIKDFESYTNLQVNSSREVVLPNGSTIMFRHIEEMNNIQNVNLGWYWIEQAEELDTDDQFMTLFGRLRRRGYPHCGFVTANTKGHNWIYKLWKSRALVETVAELIRGKPDLFKGKSADDLVQLYEATTYDNAHNLSAEFLASLEILKIQKPKIYQRFVMNLWDESETTDVIIQPQWVDKAAGRMLNILLPIRRVVSIDVARYGDDKTVFYAIENGMTLAKEVHEKKSTMETVGLALNFAKKNKSIESFAVDEIGVGAGVADRLQELEKQVVFVNSSQRSDYPEQYYNMRAEIYGTGAMAFENAKVSILRDDEQLKEQLTWAKYKAIKSNGQFQVEAKEDIKKRYGRSPDECDCFLNGIWALPRVKIAVKRDGWGHDPKPAFYLSPDAV